MESFVTESDEPNCESLEKLYKNLTILEKIELV